MAKGQILIIEDEPKIVDFIQKGLGYEGYTTEIAYDGRTALKLVKKKTYDLILLDLILPDIDGVKVCQKMRQQQVKTPILMLTVRNTVEDKVKGLDSGADDYLTKPFEFEEFLARTRALLRRKPTEPKTTQLTAANLVLNTARHEVRRGGTMIDLSPKEYLVLELLLKHLGEVLTRAQILKEVWAKQKVPGNIVDVYIAHLRQKIDKDYKKRLIRTVRGRGYKITA